MSKRDNDSKRRGRILLADDEKRPLKWMWRDSLYSNSVGSDGVAYDPLDRDEIAGGDVLGPLVTNRFVGNVAARSYNVTDIPTYGEVQRRGLDKYFDEATWATWAAMREQRKVAA